VTVVERWFCLDAQNDSDRCQALESVGGRDRRKDGSIIMRKVIITCAVTGSIHTPSMSPHLPVTPSEIADAAIGAAEAGAAIVHLHARNSQTGMPDQSPQSFAPFLSIIKQRSDCVINITTGGAPTMTVEERLRPVEVFKPEVASLNMGSMNFGLYPMLNRYKKFKYEWERPYLEGSRDRVFKNTFADIAFQQQSYTVPDIDAGDIKRQIWKTILHMVHQ